MRLGPLWREAAVMAACLTAMFFGLVASDQRWGGPVIWRITHDHGVHLGDLPVLLVWVVGLLACARVALGPRVVRPVSSPVE